MNALALRSAALTAHIHSATPVIPAGRLPSLTLRTQLLWGARVRLLVLFAAGYGIVRGVEAYGLWHARRWAEWFAALSGGIYVPFEIYELATKPSGVALAALLARRPALTKGASACRKASAFAGFRSIS